MNRGICEKCGKFQAYHARNICRKCYDIEYRQENREKMQEWQKVYYQKNKEKASRQHKAYYQKNREQILRQQKVRQQKNREKIKQYNRNNYRNGKIRSVHIAINSRKLYWAYNTEKYVHTAIAEKVLGRKLKKNNEVVHHIDGNGLNNLHNNLLICTQAYHTWLHRRMEKIRRMVKGEIANKAIESNLK